MKDREIKLCFGDCRKKLNLIPDHSVDLIFVDPPTGFKEHPFDNIIPMRDLIDEFNRISKPNGKLIVISKQPNTTDVINDLREYYDCVWYWKRSINSNIENKHKQPMFRIFEIVVFTLNQDKTAKVPTYNPQISKDYEDETSKVRYTNKYPYHILDQFPEKRGCNKALRLHKDEKPINLLEYLINTYSNKGDTVLDPFMGSGSVGIACINTDRNYFGIEWKENHFKTSCERIKEHLENKK